MVRFFVTPQELRQDTVALEGENAQHAKVLRLKAGEPVLLCDGEGQEALCRMEENGALAVEQRRSSESEAAVQVSVNAQHAKVLRLKAGEPVLLCDGEGQEALCRMEENGALAVEQRRSSESEAAVQVSVYMAFPKADKLEHVIQKATELGAYEIVAFPSSRCVSRPDEKSLKRKLERWQKIAASGAEQSGRGRIPQVVALGSYQQALERAAQADKALLF